MRDVQKWIIRIYDKDSDEDKESVGFLLVSEIESISVGEGDYREGQFEYQVLARAKSRSRYFVSPRGWVHETKQRQKKLRRIVFEGCLIHKRGPS